MKDLAIILEIVVRIYMVSINPGREVSKWDIHFQLKQCKKAIPCKIMYMYINIYCLENGLLVFVRQY